MWLWLREKIGDFVDRHLKSDFPDIYPDFCFDCNLGNDACPTCKPYQEWKEEVNQD